MRQSQRGATLGTVLLVMVVCLILTLTVVSVSMAGQQFSRTVLRRDEARNLAEAAVAEGLARVQKQLHYGQAGAEFRDISVGAEHPHAFGYLTFNRRNAAARGISYSSNHFFHNRAEPGSRGRIIPRASVHLVGLGVSGPVRHQIEAILFRPPFSEGVCCAGKVEARGVLLGGLRDPAAFAGSYATTPHTQKMAGHIFANGGGREVVQLSQGSDIRGNVRSHGGIHISSSKVQGEVQPFAPRRHVPRLDLQRAVQVMGQMDQQWNWQGAGASPARGGGDGSAARPWSGYRVITGPLTHSGDLHLNGGAVYVRGDVRIQGALRGKGCLVALGEVQIGGGGPLEPSANLSLCSTGNVTIEGQGADQSFFQGTIYAEGDIQARGLSIMGALVAPGKSTEGGTVLGNVRLDQVNVYPCPRQVSMTIGTPPDPMRLREHPPLDEFSTGSYDAMTVRIDVSEKRDGLRLYDAYLYYGRNYSWGDNSGRRGWTGNAAHFSQTLPGYRPQGPESEPIVLEGLEEGELFYRLNELVASITAGAGERTYLVDPRTLSPAHPMGGGDQLAPGSIFRQLKDKVLELERSDRPQSKVLDFNLTRRLPAEEQFRILLVRDLR